MTQAVLDLGDLDDRDLIGRVRAGDASAYAVLYERHREPAMRLARRLTTPDRAQDLVSEAFAKVLDVLGRGLGPQDSFRAYLNTTIRSVHVNGIRSSKRESLTDDYEASGADLAVHDDLAVGAREGDAKTHGRGEPHRVLQVEEVRPVADRLQLGRHRPHDGDDDRVFQLLVDGVQRVEPPHHDGSSHIRSRHRSSATGLFADCASVCALRMRPAT